MVIWHCRALCILPSQVESLRTFAGQRTAAHDLLSVIAATIVQITRNVLTDGDHHARGSRVLLP